LLGVDVDKQEHENETERPGPKDGYEIRHDRNVVDKRLAALQCSKACLTADRI
jgi:hypothetical protein